MINFVTAITLISTPNSTETSKIKPNNKLNNKNGLHC